MSDLPQSMRNNGSLAPAKSHYLAYDTRFIADYIATKIDLLKKYPTITIKDLLAVLYNVEINEDLDFVEKIFDNLNDVFGKEYPNLIDDSYLSFNLEALAIVVREELAKVIKAIPSIGEQDIHFNIEKGMPFYVEFVSWIGEGTSCLLRISYE